MRPTGVCRNCRQTVDLGEWAGHIKARCSFKYGREDLGEYRRGPSVSWNIIRVVVVVLGASILGTLISDLPRIPEKKEGTEAVVKMFDEEDQAEIERCTSPPRVAIHVKLKLLKILHQGKDTDAVAAAKILVDIYGMRNEPCPK